MSEYSTTEIQQRLSEYFDVDEVRWKPQAVRGNRAMAIAYIDARCVMDRLDDVLGIGGWQDSYVRHADGTVECTLRLRINGEWVSRTDVGSESEQTDVGDRAKAAYSDALKRAAVKFGIGRYLYRLPQTWVDFDPAKKHFVAPPRLPAWAVPKGQKQPTAPTKEPEPEPQPKPQPQAKPATNPIPTTGLELEAMLRDADAKMTAKGMIVAGALIQHILDAASRAGYGMTWAKWEKPAIEFAIKTAREFKAGLAANPQPTKQEQDPAPAVKMTPQNERDILEALHAIGCGWSEERTRKFVKELLGVTVAINDHLSVLNAEQGAKLLGELKRIKTEADAKKKKKAGAA